MMINVSLCKFLILKSESESFIINARELIKEKGKEEYLYSACYILCISESAQAWIT